MLVARDDKEAHLQRPRASISKPSTGPERQTKLHRGLDLDFVVEPGQLNNTVFGKAKAPASADGTAVTYS